MKRSIWCRGWRREWGLVLLLGVLVGGWSGMPRAADAEDPADSGPAEQREAVESRRPAERSRPVAIRSIGEVVNLFSDSNVKADERASMAVTVFGDARIEGEVDGECVTVFGNAVVNGDVRGECVTVFGDLELNSRVDGELVVVMGTATLGPKAEVSGECVVVGGRIIADPGAKFHGQKVEIGGFLSSVGEWFKSGLLLGRPIAPGVGWVWFVVGLHFLLYLLIVLLLPGPVVACERVLENQPLPAFGVGLLALILSGPLFFILAVTGVGALVVPFVWLGLKAAGLVGKAATLQWMGRSLFGRLDATTVASPLLGFLTGFALLTLIYMVPLLGFVVWGLLMPLGLGAAILAVNDAIRANRAGRTPPPPVFPPPFPSDGLPPSPTPGPAPDFTVPAAGPMTIGPQTFGPQIDPSAEILGMARAGFWIRTAATLLDFVLLGWVLSFANGFFPYLWIAYHVGMWLWKGTTIGGIVCSLKVVRVDGRPLDFSVALVRGLASVFSFLALCVGFFWAGWTPEKQSWHDKIAGTVIVKVPRGVSLI